VNTPLTLPVEQVPGHPDFCHLSSLVGVAHELRYASRNNFAGRVLYEGIDCAWIRREAGAGLERAAQWLATQRPDHRLLVLDALRPQRVQEAIWQGAAGTAIEHYFAHPEAGSIHSWGMAVDVTLLDAQGRECDMGTAYDAMLPTSHPELDAEHLARGLLTPAQVAERGWLQAAMRAGGFAGIGIEWWHFDHGQRQQVRRDLPRVL
jgi:zinc D-Ala-D-Ala dipeptidase